MKLGRRSICQKLKGGVQSFSCPDDRNRENNPTPIRARNAKKHRGKKNRDCSSGVNPRVMLAANHALDPACCVIKAANPTCELEWTRRSELFRNVAHTRAGLDII